MSKIEKLIVKIGELVSTEIDEVDKVEYVRDRETAFIIAMQNGKRYILQIATET